MKRIILLVSLIGIATIAFSQKDTVRFRFPITAEYSPADVNGLNEQLIILGYPAYTHTPVTLQFGLSITAFRLRYATSFILVNRKPDTYGDTSVLSKNRFFSFELGYEVVQTRKFSFYPMVGYKSLGIHYRWRVDEDLSLTNYLQSSVAFKELKYDRGHLMVGVGLEYGKKVSVGLRGGWYIPLGKGEWRYAGYSGRNIKPKVDYSYFVGVHVGIWLRAIGKEDMGSLFPWKRPAE